MPEDRQLWDTIAANRTRIETIEAEVGRLRERAHKLEGEASAVRYFGERMTTMSNELHELTRKLETLARQAMARPTSRQVSTIIAALSFLLALAAFLYAATHSG
jgi:hypothetical protein